MFKKIYTYIKYPSVLLMIILLFSLLIRVYQINFLPSGINIDEVSQGYNAYSLLLTGKDRYGKVLPILFKSYESFQPPMYTYLTILPTMLFGKSNLALRFVSILSSIIVIILSFSISKKLFPGNKYLPVIVSFVVSISPWSIFFSRYATEASLGLMLILGAIYFLLASDIKRIHLITGFILLGLSTHAYYTERILAFLILLGFTIFYREFLVKNMKIFILGLSLFFLILSPHLVMMKEGAFFRRFDQVTYTNKYSFEKYGGKYGNNIMGRILYIGNEFSSQYIAYFSPKNLFYSPDPQAGRSIPGLSVFYSWMLIPFISGLGMIIKIKINKKEKFMLWIALISVIPASLSTDPFYTLRVLLFLWFVSLTIALGINGIFKNTSRKDIVLVLFSLIFVVSFFDFYRKYFILFKVERAENFGLSDRLIAEYLRDYKGKVLVDLSERNIASGLKLAYYLDFSPVRFQKEIGVGYLDDYYTGYDTEKTYTLDNIEIRPINWIKDVFTKQLIIGDSLSISENQAREHKFILKSKIDKLSGGGGNIYIYETDPSEKCKSITNGKTIEKCLNLGI